MKFRLYIILFVAATLWIFSPAHSFAATFQAGGIRLNKKVTPMREIKRQHVVPQSLDFSCGAAGLSTLLNFYLEDPVTETTIIETLLNTIPLEKVIARKGFSLLDLKTFAKNQGYKVTGYKMDIEFLKEIGKPVLVPISFRKYHHFVIVRAVIADRVFLADPAAGNLSMKISKFKQIWQDGIGLVIEEKGGDEPKNYALKIDDHDFIIAQYAQLKRLVDQTLTRTAIYPTEF